MTPPSLTVAAFLHLLYSGTQLPAQMFFHQSYKLNFIVHQTFVTTCRIKSTLQCMVTDTRQFRSLNALQTALRLKGGSHALVNQTFHNDLPPEKPVLLIGIEYTIPIEYFYISVILSLC